jgi:hypothetical protein
VNATDVVVIGLMFAAFIGGYLWAWNESRQRLHYEAASRRGEQGKAKQREWLLWHHIKRLWDERDQMHAAILAYGNNPAGFDYGVLDEIEQLEKERDTALADAAFWNQAADDRLRHFQEYATQAMEHRKRVEAERDALVAMLSESYREHNRGLPEPDWVRMALAQQQVRDGQSETIEEVLAETDIPLKSDAELLATLKQAADQIRDKMQRLDNADIDRAISILNEYRIGLDDPNGKQQKGGE